MNPSNCPILPGPYVPPDCIPWPQNEHEVHVVVAIWVVTWTLGLLLLFLDIRRLEAAEAAKAEHSEIKTEAPAQYPNIESVEVRS
jgi:hypothetical protein